MEVIEYGDIKISVDDEGYLVDAKEWNEKVACGLAEHEGIEELTRERMDVIRFMRNYYDQYHAFPILRSVCRNVHQPKNCVREDFLDPIRAWKIAGLPKPLDQVVSELEGKGGVV